MKYKKKTQTNIVNLLKKRGQLGFTWEESLKRAKQVEELSLKDFNRLMVITRNNLEYGTTCIKFLDKLI